MNRAEFVPINFLIPYSLGDYNLAFHVYQAS